VEHLRPMRSDGEGPASFAVPRRYSGTCVRGGLDGEELRRRQMPKRGETGEQRGLPVAEKVVG
jgi:CO/xanthine dehydrogenase Mo-binding subunit